MAEDEPDEVTRAKWTGNSPTTRRRVGRQVGYGMAYSSPFCIEVKAQRRDQSGPLARVVDIQINDVEDWLLVQKSWVDSEGARTVHESVPNHFFTSEVKGELQQRAVK